MFTQTLDTALLDTNILITAEDTDVNLPQCVAEVLQKASDQIVFYVHKKSYEDIQQDSDKERSDRLLSRVGRYKLLDSSLEFDPDYFAQQGWANKKRNDEVDNTLLACVLEDQVKLLITNDKDMKQKAIRSGIGSRVMSLDELDDYLSVPLLRESANVVDSSCEKLDGKDPFFDSLREDYGKENFDAWLQQCSWEHRGCWRIDIGERLVALCIYKYEEPEIINDGGFNPGCGMLKLCTLKVAEEYQGSKAGERLLWKAFEYARSRDIDFTYLTVFEEKHPSLVQLLQEFGFQKHGHKSSTGERVMGKFLAPQTASDRILDKVSFYQRFYPSYKDGTTVKKFLVPIRKAYHERLFPDVSDFAESLLGHDPVMYPAESNTIRKAYLCKSPITRITEGDLLLFYRSGDRQSVQVLGVVTYAERLGDVEQIYKVTHKRTVYTQEEIYEMLGNDDSLLVICFDLIQYFHSQVTKSFLEQIGRAAPQSICGINDEQFKKIMRQAKA